SEKLYGVAVTWSQSGKIEPQRISDALSPLGDWYRFNGMFWLLWTNLGSAEEVQGELRKSLTLDESVLIARIDLSDYHGWASKQTWDWLHSKVQLSDVLKSRTPPFGSYGGPGMRTPFSPLTDENK